MISILFIGKYDDDMLNLEDMVVNMYNKQKKTVFFKPDGVPDVVRFPNENPQYCTWTILGDVKPTLLLKNLISEVDIIIFTFNWNNPVSFAFLKEGWGPIIDKVGNSANKNQKRFLVGTNSNPEFGQNDIIIELIEKEECKNFEELIEKTKDNFKCSNFIKEITKSNSAQLIKLVQDEITRNKIKEHKHQNSQISNQPKLIEHSKGQIQPKAKSAELEEEKEKDDGDESENQNEQEESIEPIQDIEDENPIKITDKNRVDYLLFTKSKTADILKISSEVTKEIFISQFIEYKQKKYVITKIRDHAFKNSQIQGLSFSDGSKLQKIGNYAFEGSKLKKFIIPSSVEIIEEFCFEGCQNLEEMEVEESNRYFSVSKGFLYYYPNGINHNEPLDSQTRNKIFAKTNISHSLTNGVKAIFTKSKNLLTINHESLIRLYGHNLSKKCQNIHHIMLNSDKIELSNNYYNQNVHLQTIEITCKELAIGDVCFTNCPNLSSISFHKLNKAIIGQHSFNDCDSLKSIEINCSNYLELKEKCFSGNRSIETIKISSQKISFGENSFTNCLSLTEIQILSNQLEIGIYCFCKSDKLKNVTIKGVKELQIPEGCFENCTLLKTFSIPDATDVILSQYAFKGCSHLNQFLIPKAISISIAQLCFGGATQLKSIEINCSEMTLFGANNNQIIQFNDKALNKIKTLTIHIINNNFKYEVINKFSSIETIIIKSEQELTIKCNAFDIFKSLERVDINTTSTLYIEKDFDFNNSKINSIELNSATINIGSNSFNKARDLDILSINSNEIKIDEKCFNNLPNLQTIYLEGERLIVGNSCFQNCSKLENLTMKNINYVFLGFEPFQGCNRLNSIDIIPSVNILTKYFTKEGQIGTTQSSYQVEEKINKNKLFAKSISIETDTKEKCSSFFKHMLKLTKLKNNLILPIEGFAFNNFNNERYATIFTVFVSSNSLEEVMNKNILSNVQKFSILIGLTIGMKYLHSKSIIHKNLKPSNIFLDKQRHPHISEYSMPPLNKTKYTPPEITNGSRYSFEGDIYSYSIIAIELLTGPIQFNKDTNNKKFKETILGRFKNPQIPKLFERCISATPTDRPSFDDIYDEITQWQFIKSFNLNLDEINKLFKYYGIQIEYKPEETNVKQDTKNPNESKIPPTVSHNVSTNNAAIKLTNPSQQLTNDNSSNNQIAKSPKPEKEINVKQETKTKNESNMQPNIELNDSSGNAVIKSPKPQQQSQVNLSSSNLRNDGLTITRYLKSELYTKSYKLLTIKINDKHKISESLKEYTSRFIKSQSSDFIYYTIHKTNWIVEYFNPGMLVDKLPSAISFQMKPGKKYLIFVVCNIQNIESNFKLNENCFSIAIEFNPKNKIENLKQKIINYLRKDKEYTITNDDPIIYIFKNNQRKVLQNYQEIENERTPLFISFKDFQTIKSHISDNTENKNGELIIITKYLRTKLFDKCDNKYVNPLRIVIARDQFDMNLGELSSKILTYSKNKTLFYTINPKNNYNIEYFNKQTLVRNLQSKISVQYQPGEDYRASIICDITKIESEFRLNENCFSFAIEFNPKYKIQELKKKIIDYLQLSPPLNKANPTIYIFKDNQFKIIRESKELNNNTIPLFVSFESDIFRQIKNNINIKISNESWQNYDF